MKRLMANVMKLYYTEDGPLIKRVTSHVINNSIRKSYHMLCVLASDTADMNSTNSTLGLGWSFPRSRFRPRIDALVQHFVHLVVCRAVAILTHDVLDAFGERAFFRDLHRGTLPFCVSLVITTHKTSHKTNHKTNDAAGYEACRTTRNQHAS